MENPTMVRAILIDTKAFIKSHGWTQRTYVDMEGKVCLSYALDNSGECEYSDTHVTLT